MEAQRELRKLIRNNEGRYFLVRIVTPGMHHGRDDCLLYGEDGFANSNDDVLVEFYDFTYATAVKTDSAFGERGQFVGSYYRKTLLGEDGFGHGDLDVYGLDLDGGVPVWKVDAKAMSEVYQWLRSEPVAGEIAEAISEANSEAKSGPEIEAEMPSLKITIKVENDTVISDLSYLGEFTDQPWYEGVNGNKLVDTARIFDRFAEGTLRRGEPTYFVATDQLGETNPKTGKPWARSTRRKYARQQWQRAESYGDDWQFVYVRADAAITQPGHRATLHFSSDGISGVESDSDSTYFQSLFDEEVESLRDEALKQGITEEQFAAAWADAIGEVQGEWL